MREEALLRCVSTPTICRWAGCTESATSKRHFCSRHQAESEAANVATLEFGNRAMPEGNRTNLYAILCGNFVKFGVAANVKSRLGNLRTSNPYPLELLASIPCSSGLEWLVHEYLREDVERGEWFKKSPRSKALVLLMIAGDIAGILDLIRPSIATNDSHSECCLTRASRERR
jgi:hypothetical protein